MIKRIASSKLLKTFSTYTFSSILSNAIPFFLIPILTRFLTPQDYGVVSMFGLTLNIFSIFVMLGLPGAVQREYYDEKINIKRYLFNVFIIFTASALTIIVLIILFNDFFSKVTQLNIILLCTALFLSYISSYTSTYLILLRAKMQARKYATIQISQSILNALLSIIFVVFLKMNWQGRICAQLLATVLIGIPTMFYLYTRWAEPKIDFEYIKRALIFGIPLVFHNIGGLLITASDRFLITNMVSIDKTGLYTVGYQLASVIGILATSFNFAYAPWLYDKLNLNNEKVKVMIVKLTYLYFGLITLGGTMYSLTVTSFLDVIVGKRFSDARVVIFWLVLGQVGQGLYYMVTNYIFYARKTHYLAVLTFLTGIFNFVVSYLLIKVVGYQGAAMGTALAHILEFFLTWWLSNKVYKMPWFGLLSIRK